MFALNGHHQMMPDGPEIVTLPPPNRKASYGAMKHTLKGPLGDLITPIDVAWEALQDEPEDVT